MNYSILTNAAKDAFSGIVPLLMGFGFSLFFVFGILFAVRKIRQIMGDFDRASKNIKRKESAQVARENSQRFREDRALFRKQINAFEKRMRFEQDLADEKVWKQKHKEFEAYYLAREIERAKDALPEEYYKYHDHNGLNVLGPDDYAAIEEKRQNERYMDEDYWRMLDDEAEELNASDPLDFSGDWKEFARSYYEVGTVSESEYDHAMQNGLVPVSQPAFIGSMPSDDELDEYQRKSDEIRENEKWMAFSDAEEFGGDDVGEVARYRFDLNQIEDEAHENGLPFDLESEFQALRAAEIERAKARGFGLS